MVLQQWDFNLEAHSLFKSMLQRNKYILFVGLILFFVSFSSNKNREGEVFSQAESKIGKMLFLKQLSSFNNTNSSGADELFFMGNTNTLISIDITDRKIMFWHIKSGKEREILIDKFCDCPVSFSFAVDHNNSTIGINFLNAIFIIQLFEEEKVFFKKIFYETRDFNVWKNRDFVTWSSVDLENNILITEHFNEEFRVWDMNNNKMLYSANWENITKKSIFYPFDCKTSPKIALANSEDFCSFPLHCMMNYINKVMICGNNIEKSTTSLRFFFSNEKNKVVFQKMFSLWKEYPIALHPTKPIMASIKRNKIVLRNVHNGKIIKELIFPIKYTSKRLHTWIAKFSRDGKYLAQGMTNGEIKIWNVESGEEVGIFLGKDHSSTILSLDFNDKGDLLATGDDDGNIKVWKILK